MGSEFVSKMMVEAVMVAAEGTCCFFGHSDLPGDGCQSQLGGRGNNRNKNYLNSVDVSDLPRLFSPEEWQKLRDGNHVKYIISMRDKAA